MKIKNLCKKVFQLGAVMVLLPGLMLLSASNERDKPIVKKGAEVTIVSGTLVHWKDIVMVDFTKTPGKRVMRPVMNFENPRKIVKKSAAVDPVVQAGFGKDARDPHRGSLAMPTPMIHFAGMNLSANGAGWPPDTNGDVGMNYYVQVVNTSIGIYNKSTGAPVSTTTFDAFFPSAVGSPCDNDNNGDPIVHYDPYNQRWILYDFAWSGTGDGSYFSIAASKTSDPTGAWWTYCLHADNTLMNDYPKSGVWHDGIYVTANMFQFSDGFQHVKIWAFKAPGIYNGTLTVQSLTDNSYEAWSIMPSNAKGTTPPSAGTPNYMFALDADEYGSPSIDAIYWWKLAVNWTTPANTTWSGPYTMTTAAFGLTSSRVPQPDTSTTLDSLYGRLMYPAIYRKAPTEAVYLNHVCEYSSRRAERWYEIRISGGNCSIYQQGTYSPDTDHRWMGSVAGDKNGNIALGYSVSSSSVYPSIRYAGRLVGDPLNQLSQGEATMIAGTGSQTSYTRWGDYSGITLDPADDETFWYTTEYYSSTGTNWQTRIGSFKFSAPVTDFNNDGKTDILLRYYGTGGWNQVWYMNGVTKTGNAGIPQVADLNWKIEGTGDFNNDGKTDILLRYYGTGGWNQVWYMNGVTKTGTASLPQVADLNWKIEGTGDFNNDGKTDILLRYYGTGGWIQVWYMNGVTKIGTASLPPIADLNWKIEGTGDFNNDGKTDILLRYYGTGGWNQVWYMNGVTKTGTASLPVITDLNWKFQGTGDFNNDGKVDIILRYYGTGGWNQVWYMNGVTKTGTASLPNISDLTWGIVN